MLIRLTSFGINRCIEYTEYCSTFQQADPSNLVPVLYFCIFASELMRLRRAGGHSTAYWVTGLIASAAVRSNYDEEEQEEAAKAMEGPEKPNAGRRGPQGKYMDAYSVTRSGGRSLRCSRAD